MIEPFARLLNLPEMGEAEVLLITINIVSAGNVPLPISTKANVAPLSMITPRALTSEA